MTWLGFINYFVQFLFIRIYASYDANGESDRNLWTIKGYGVLYFVFPLTGWFNNYIILNKKVNGERKLKFTKLLYSSAL